MTCSCPPGRTTGTFFSKRSRTYARRFKRSGLAAEQKLLIDGICRRPLEGATILEIGCGVGGVHLTLLQRGAQQATGIDLAEGMLDGARLLASEYGLADRVRYLLGDAVLLGRDVPPADLVVMDKVVCCYANLPALLATAVGRTGTTLALTYPRPAPLVALSMKLLIVLRRLFRRAFVPSWHDWHRMVDEITSGGFQERYRSSTFFWCVAVFDRLPAGTAEAATA